MPLRSQYWIPSIILLISFCLHLSLMSKGPVTLDCLSLVINSQATLETHHLHYLYGSGYPLMVLLGSIFIAMGKYIGIADPVLAVNFISVLFSSTAILAFYLLVQRICDTLTAVLAFFILLLNPISLDISTYGINHAPALCFLLLGQLSLLRFQTAGNITNLLLSALYFGFMGATRLQDFILTFPAISFMFTLGLKDNSSQSIKHEIRYFPLFIMTTILIIMLFHLPYFIFDHDNYILQAESNWKLHLAGGLQKLFSRYLVSSLSCLIKNFNIVGIICFGAGLYYTAVLNKRLLIFTILWWTIPLCLFGNDITNAPRYLNILLPAIIIPISIFLTHKLRNKEKVWRLLAMISLLIIIFQPLLITQETFIRRHHYALIPDFYRWVGKSTERDATIISSDDGLFITYYSGRNILRKPNDVAGHISPKELTDFKRKLDHILTNGKPVYITELAFIQYDRYREFSKLMQQNYHLSQVGQMTLELWYNTPFDIAMGNWGLVKIKR